VKQGFIPRFIVGYRPQDLKDIFQLFTSWRNKQNANATAVELEGPIKAERQRHRCCFLGVAFGCTFIACSINSLGTPSISAGFHANMSWLARRKLTSASYYLSPKPAPMTAVLDESPSWSWIVLKATSSVNWMLNLLAFLEGISSPDWESYCAAASTSPKASGTRVVEAYWIAS
jgi:hypothetical protein